MSNRVTFLAPPRWDSLLNYQRYYVQGLAERRDVRTVGGPPLVSRVCGSLAAIDAMVWLGLVGRRLRIPVTGHETPVGRYLVESGNALMRVAIDPFDNHRIGDEGTLAWSDVYFKANRWPSAEYDPRVLPLVNGNGILDSKRLAFLRSLRDVERDIDVTFIANVWGGRDHVVRIFEELARLDCRKELLAVFPWGDDPDDRRQLAKRLDRAGVPHTAREIPPEQLWRSLARSRIVMVRSGRHLCIPWRMIDLLAMGACPLFDAVPYPRWPEPLVEDVHYLSCGLVRGPVTPPAPDEYAKIGCAVERALDDEILLARVRAASARYYTEHAAPERVADWILGQTARCSEGVSEGATATMLR